MTSEMQSRLWAIIGYKRNVSENTNTLMLDKSIMIVHIVKCNIFIHIQLTNRTVCYPMRKKRKNFDQLPTTNSSKANTSYDVTFQNAHFFQISPDRLLANIYQRYLVCLRVCINILNRVLKKWGNKIKLYLLVNKCIFTILIKVRL